MQKQDGSISQESRSGSQGHCWHYLKFLDLWNIYQTDKLTELKPCAHEHSIRGHNNNNNTNKQQRYQQIKIQSLQNTKQQDLQAWNVTFSSSRVESKRTYVNAARCANLVFFYDRIKLPRLEEMSGRKWKTY